MEDLPDSQEGLQGMLESLNVELQKLEEKKKAVLSALSKKDEPTAEAAEQPTIQDITIVFVEEIEKAHQYYDFKDFLRKTDVVKPEHDAVETLLYLVNVLKVQEDLRFNKLDFKLIMDAVQSYILYRKRRDCHKESIQGNTSCEESSEEGNDWYSLMTVKERTLVRRIDPIVRLVYHIREKGHVMDKDPLVELEYIKKFDGLYYKCCFRWGLLEKRSEREVMVLFVPLHFKEKEMKDALSICGNAVSVKFESIGPWSKRKVAYVIFENSVAAKLAPVIMNRTSSFYIEPVRKQCEYQPKDALLYQKAVFKYEELRNYSKKSKIEPMQA